MSDCCNCSHKSKERSEEEYKSLINRLSRIEGQIRGIKRMVEDNAYCTDIITQAAAAASALNSFNKEFLIYYHYSNGKKQLKQPDSEVIIL